MGGGQPPFPTNGDGLDRRQPVWGSGVCKDTPDNPPVSKVKEKKGIRVVQTRDLKINFPVFKMVTKSLHIQTETCGTNFCIQDSGENIKTAFPVLSGH